MCVAGRSVRSTVERLAGEPCRAVIVELPYRRSLQHGHVALDGEADLRLRVGKIAVTLGKLAEEFGVEMERRAGIERVDAILFVDRLAQHDRPARAAVLEKIVEAPGA